MANCPVCGTALRERELRDTPAPERVDHIYECPNCRKQWDEALVQSRPLANQQV